MDPAVAQERMPSTDATLSSTPPSRAARVARWLRWVSLLLPLLAFAHIARRLLHAPAPPPIVGQGPGRAVHAALPETERLSIYADIADHDAEWWRLAGRWQDAWSQHDDYHCNLGRHVAGIAVAKKLDETTLFLIYDEGVRRHLPDAHGRALKATWVPLQPRAQ